MSDIGYKLESKRSTLVNIDEPEISFSPFSKAIKKKKKTSLLSDPKQKKTNILEKDFKNELITPLISEDFELIDQFESELWFQDSKCWSPIAEISRLSAGESETEDEDDIPRKKRPLLSLDYREDFKPQRMKTNPENPSIENNGSYLAQYIYAPQFLAPNQMKSVMMAQQYIQPVGQYPYYNRQLIQSQTQFQQQQQFYQPLFPQKKGGQILYPPPRKSNSNAGYRLSDMSFISC